MPTEQPNPLRQSQTESAWKALKDIHAEVQSNEHLRFPPEFATQRKSGAVSIEASQLRSAQPAEPFGSNHPQHIFAAPNAVYHPRHIDASDYYDIRQPEMVHIRGGTLSGLTPN